MGGSMYLAKFFQRAPGNDDRELLLILEGSGGDPHVLMGFVMGGPGEPQMRREFIGVREAVAALRRAAENLRLEGYVETVHTQYQLRALPPHPKPKPAWQQGLDELLLCAMVEDSPTQSALLAKLAATPAAQEPLYLWLAARHEFAGAPKGHARALARAENARDTLGARRASKMPPYLWSLRPLKVEAFIHDLLCEIHFAAGRPQAALDEAQHAQEAEGNQYRGGRIAWILAHCFPAREEEAFAEAARYAELGGYEAVTALPSYAAYVGRRATAATKGRRASRPRP
jgi:hypothetical protein